MTAKRHAVAASQAVSTGTSRIPESWRQRPVGAEQPLPFKAVEKMGDPASIADGVDACRALDRAAGGCVAFLRRNIIQQDLEVGRRPCSPGHELGPAEMVQLLTNAGFPDVRWPTLPPRAPARAVPS